MYADVQQFSQSSETGLQQGVKSAAFADKTAEASGEEKDTIHLKMRTKIFQFKKEEVKGSECYVDV